MTVRKMPRSQRRSQHWTQHHRTRYYRTLGACLGAAGLAVTAGCAVAPAGAAGTSPAIGPVRTGAATKNFAPFPVPTLWRGQGGTPYAMVVKAKTGTKPHNFRVIATSEMVFWLNCLGTGTARLSSPAIRLTWTVRCGRGADPAAVNFRPPAARVGHGADVGVTVTPGARWEVRIDAMPKPGTTVDAVPARPRA